MGDKKARENAGYLRFNLIAERYKFLFFTIPNVPSTSGKLMSQSPNRYRGVVLTPLGAGRLEKAIILAQDQEKFGSRFTQAELSERAKLSIKTTPIQI